MAILIDKDRCTGCGLCDVNCPGDIIHMDEKTNKPVLLYSDECWYCGACRIDCPVDCIKIVFPLNSL